MNNYNAGVERLWGWFQTPEGKCWIEKNITAEIEGDYHHIEQMQRITRGIKKGRRNHADD